MSALSTLATVPFRSDIYVWSPVVFTSHRYVIVKLVRSSRSRVSSTFCGTGSTQSGTTGVKAGVALSRLSNTVQLRYREPTPWPLTVSLTGLYPTVNFQQTVRCHYWKAVIFLVTALKTSHFRNRYGWRVNSSMKFAVMYEIIRLFCQESITRSA